MRMRFGRVAQLTDTISDGRCARVQAVVLEGDCRRVSSSSLDKRFTAPWRLGSGFWLLGLSHDAGGGAPEFGDISHRPWHHEYERTRAPSNVNYV